MVAGEHDIGKGDQVFTLQARFEENAIGLGEQFIGLSQRNRVAVPLGVNFRGFAVGSIDLFCDFSYLVAQLVGSLGSGGIFL